MTRRKICSKCKFFTEAHSPGAPAGQTFGECALIDDKKPTDDTQAYAWDYESYLAGVTVGANFGCIHWEAK